MREGHPGAVLVFPVVHQPEGEGEAVRIDGIARCVAVFKDKGAAS